MRLGPVEPPHGACGLSSRFSNVRLTSLLFPQRCSPHARVYFLTGCFTPFSYASNISGTSFGSRGSPESVATEGEWLLCGPRDSEPLPVFCPTTLGTASAPLHADRDGTSPPAPRPPPVHGLWVEGGAAASTGWGRGPQTLTAAAKGRDMAPCPLSPHVPTVSPAVFSSPAMHGWGVGVDLNVGTGAAGVARALRERVRTAGGGTRVGAAHTAL